MYQAEDRQFNALENILFDGKTVGTKQDYIDNYGEKPLGVFICSIVGLDATAAQEALFNEMGCRQLFTLFGFKTNRYMGNQEIFSEYYLK